MTYEDRTAAPAVINNIINAQVTAVIDDHRGAKLFTALNSQ